ncbi:hypothetical protein [Agrobacterium sp. AGB01]|nr:hypothetical protein [Agrobacterium sp. AGB01]
MDSTLDKRPPDDEGLGALLDVRRLRLLHATGKRLTDGLALRKR